MAAAGLRVAPLACAKSEEDSLACAKSDEDKEDRLDFGNSRVAERRGGDREAESDVVRVEWEVVGGVGARGAGATRDGVLRATGAAGAPLEGQDKPVNLNTMS